MSHTKLLSGDLPRTYLAKLSETPSLVYAIQWTGENTEDVKKLTCVTGDESLVQVVPGDYVIRTANHKFYVAAEDFFVTAYKAI